MCGKSWEGGGGMDMCAVSHGGVRGGGGGMDMCVVSHGGREGGGGSYEP